MSRKPLPPVIVLIAAGLIGLASAGPIATAAEAPAPYVLGGRLEPARPDARKPAEAEYRLADWDMFVPEDWDPMRSLGNLDFSRMSDNDPRAIQALMKLQDEWKNAPVNASLDDTRIRIAGFVVPLDGSKGRTKEFLLVPYYGACIHTPPPPSNQIIHVVSSKGVAGLSAMDAVWVSGTLKVERAQTSMGAAGYRMSGDLVEAYSETATGGTR